MNNVKITSIQGKKEKYYDVDCFENVFFKLEISFIF